MATIEIRDVLDNETGKTIFPRTHVDAVIGLKDSSFFEKVQDELDPTKYSVKLKSEYTGLWAEGWIAAGGVGSGSGGGGGGGLITAVKGVADLGTPIQSESLTETFSAKAIESIFEGLDDFGASLSLSVVSSYFKDSNGNYFLDANGNRIVVGGAGSSYLNLLNKSGRVLSSVELDLDMSNYASKSWVSQNFLTQETDPTVPSWAKSASKPTYALSEISGTDDLRAIEALSGVGGLLRKTATNTWSLDTSDYLPLSGGTMTGGIVMSGASIVPSANNTSGLGSASTRFSCIYGVNADLTGNLSLASSSHIDIGPLRLVFENNALHITKADPNDQNEYGIYADGFVAAGGVGETS